MDSAVDRVGWRVTWLISIGVEIFYTLAIGLGVKSSWNLERHDLYGELVIIDLEWRLCDNDKKYIGLNSALYDIILY